LRESLAGPKDHYQTEEGQPIKRWRYTYDADGEMTLSFENLGFALLADCDGDSNRAHQIMLMHLLK